MTMAMTNLAPVFGARVGQAYITASANYLVVVMFHSGPAIIPMLAAWAFLLGRYDFDPRSVMVVYGFTGTLAESGAFGLQNLVASGIWVFVCGLMVYLPAYAVSPMPATKKPRLRHYPLALLLPIACAVPVALVVLGVFHHSTVEFGG